jgi:hypothetical protein
MELTKHLSISGKSFRSAARRWASWLVAAGLTGLSAGSAATPGAATPAGLAWVPTGFTPPLPTDGALGFSYTRAPAVTGCSQNTEAELRELLIGVVHTDPFAPAGKPPTFTLQVEMTRPAQALIRATFSLFDAKGAPRGVSTVEDETCDGAHLKLLASIALLLQPRPEGPCDAACRAKLEKEAYERAGAEIRERELPKLREEARAAARKEAEEQGRRDFRAVIGAGGAVAFNAAADPAAGFWLAAEARGERWSVGLEMRALMPARAFDFGGAAVLQQASATVLLVPCLRWKWLAGCGLVEAGGVFVMGPGVAPGSSSSAAVLGLGLRARLEVPIAAGFEARVFADLLGYPVGLAARGATEAASFAFDAPRRIAGVAGLGLVRSFD